ncbi:MAG: DUF1887 family protein [Bacteroidetes bacterium]|nr:DUF1887 family protein [Bacteroidota bacterium]
MGRKVIVSLVSDQSIPNILFIKEKGLADYYYFITTEIMEKRGIVSNILKSLDINEEQTKRIEVIEDSVKDIDDNLVNNLLFEDDDEILINITGGTKIMSLAVYNFFARSGSGDIFYIPIGKNEIKQIFPLRKNRVSIINKRVNLLEYLTAYGVKVREESFRSKNNLLKDQKQTTDLFNSFLTDKRNTLFQVAEEIRETGLRGKKITANEPKKAEYFNKAKAFQEAGVSWENPGEISKYESKYITGEWFEEYIYPRIKDWLNKNDDEIGLGLQLEKGNAPNEYDIMFTHNNALYVIECKTDVADDTEGKINYLFTNTLYKAATLKKEFGLWVNYYLFALNDFSNLSDIQKDRAKQLDIKLVGLEILNDENKFKEYIQK